jgi:hypothetical protein
MTTVSQERIYRETQPTGTVSSFVHSAAPIASGRIGVILLGTPVQEPPSFVYSAAPIASGRIGVILLGTPVQEPQGMFAYWRSQAGTWFSTAEAEAREEVLARQFQTLADRWHRETDGMSNPIQMAMHPDYQGIMVRGRDFLPFILNDLETHGGDWYIALRAICRAYDWQPPEIPPDASGNMKRVNDIWIRWGRERVHGSWPPGT